MKSKHPLLAAATLISLFGPAASLLAEVKPNSLFTAGAVLQRDCNVPVWGTARDGEKVTVEFGSQKVTTTAKGGTWNVSLAPLTAGGPFTMKITGDNVVNIENLLVGEVWVCSGQSNMQFALGGATTGSQEIPKANYPKIRFFSVPRKIAIKPITDCNGAWAECTPETARHFSAVAYFFGRDLHKKLDVPIGLIHSSWGGTPAEAWTSIEALKSDPQLNNLATAANKNEAGYAAASKAYPAKLEAHEKRMEAWTAAGGPANAQAFREWQQQMIRAKQQGKPHPKKPASASPQPMPPAPPDGTSKTPTVLYNGMIAPLLPYAIKGAIWYQGESNAKQHRQYQVLFPTMIADWRGRWKQGNFPFLFVQIAPFNGMAPEIREAQLLTLTKSPNTTMTVITDVGDANDIHPKRKEPVGQRLALAARAIAYKEDIVYSGPLYQSMKVEGGKAVVSFTHTGGGMVAKDGELKGFTIAGPDDKFVPAKAEIKGTEIMVSSAEVSAPKAVRYGWSSFPEVNLYNKEGIPASPFRTDLP